MTLDRVEILKRGVAAMKASGTANLWQACRFSAMLGFLNTEFVGVADDMVRQMSVAPEDVDERLRAPASPLRVALLMQMAAQHQAPTHGAVYRTMR